MKALKSHQCFDGVVQFWEHDSKETGTKMNFSTFTPPGEVKGCIFWLSGLSCTDENFMAKAGAQKHLAKHGLMVICPDTSPRGLKLPNEHDNWDFGAGASFYVNSTTEGYRDHYRMYDYVTKELTALVSEHFGVTKLSIMGHSMGGHGALVMGLREADIFKSVSAFSPIVNPMQVPWGQKAFAGYLGDDKKAWASYDTCELIRAGYHHAHPLLIDQGTSDSFLEVQLKTENLVKAAEGTNQKLQLRYRTGYDHGYYFIATFVHEHIEFHARYLSSH
jgi:S-formylglutathione hydrolase